MWFCLASHITNGTIPNNFGIKEIKSAKLSVAQHPGQLSLYTVLTGSVFICIRWSLDTIMALCLRRKHFLTNAMQLLFLAHLNCVSNGN